MYTYHCRFSLTGASQLFSSRVYYFFILCVFATGFSENHLWLAGVPVSSPASLRFPRAGPQEVLWFYQAQEHMTRHTSQGGRLTPRGEALKGVDGD